MIVLLKSQYILFLSHEESTLTATWLIGWFTNILYFYIKYRKEKNPLRLGIDSMHSTACWMNLIDT